MKVIRQAVAGTLESSDLLVRVAPSEKGAVDIVIRSQVLKQFGTQIRHVINDTLDKLAVSGGSIVVEDKGALDCVIRARVQAAVLRACDVSDPPWERLS